MFVARSRFVLELDSKTGARREQEDSKMRWKQEESSGILPDPLISNFLINKLNLCIDMI